MERRKGRRLKEDELQKGAKWVRVTHTLVDRRSDSQVEAPAWDPALILDGALLSANASIKNFQQRKSGYVANAVKQALLLPEDVVEW